MSHTVNRSSSIAAWVAILAFFLTASPAPAQDETNTKPIKPRNIIIIFADDVAWNDLSCYGATHIQTPNLDRLAAQGIRFTDAHVASPFCSASRYALLSGDVAVRNAKVKPVLQPGDPYVFSDNQINLPRLMKKANYTTALIGKWHLGIGATTGSQDWNGVLRPGALEAGFDYFYGYSTTNDRTPCVYIDQDRVVNLDPNDPLVVTQLADETLGTSHMVAGIRRATAQKGGASATWKDEQMAVHFTEKVVQYIETHRSEPFFLLFTSHNIHNPTRPHPRFQGTSRAGQRGDTVHELDWSVGEILKKLDALSLTDDTLILFSSDNGGAGKRPDNPSEHDFGGPFRGQKSTPYEGGCRVPTILSWRSQVRGGQVSDVTWSMLDVLASFAALTGQTLEPNEALDSWNMLPALLGKDTKQSRPFLMTIGGRYNYLAKTIRQDGWKLIDYTEQPGKPELFHLERDLGETTDRAADFSEKVRLLREALNRELSRTTTVSGQR